MKIKQTVRTHYHWIVAAVAFLMIAVVLGLANNLFSLYLIPVTGDLGVSRGAFSMMPSIKAVASFGANLLLAVVYSRYGFHKPAFVAMFLLGLSYVCFGIANNMAPFYFGAALCGFAEPFCGTAAASRLVSDWFDRHRGAVLGVVLAASGVGASLMTAVLSGVIDECGWRMGYYCSAVLVIVMAVTLLLVCDTPKKMGLRPLGAGEPVRKKSGRTSLIREWEGLPMHSLLRLPYFYVAMAAVFLVGLTTLGVYPVLAAHLQDRGMSSSFSASMLSLLFFMLAVAKVVVGFLLDRFGAKAMVLLCAVCNIVGIVILAYVTTQGQALCYVLIYSVALAMQTVTMPAMAAELFGRHSFSVTLSIMMAVMALSGAVASPLVNYSYDLRGSYAPILLVMAGVAVVIFVLLLVGFRGAAGCRKKQEIPA